MSERKAANVKLSDIISKPLVKTGSEILPGSYAGTLIGFSEPFLVPVADQFKKAGKSEEQIVFEAIFAIKVKKNLERVEFLLSPPQGGKISIKSNVYKMLRSLDPAKIDADGNFIGDVKIEDFIGRNGTVEVAHNAKNSDFVKVKQVAAAMDGLTYPTIEESQPLLAEKIEPSGDVPF